MNSWIFTKSPDQDRVIVRKRNYTINAIKILPGEFLKRFNGSWLKNLLFSSVKTFGGEMHARY